MTEALAAVKPVQPVTHVTACRLCDSQDLDLVVSFTPTPPGDQYIMADQINEPQPCYPLDVMCCRGCGAVQLADTVDPALIYPDYLYTTSVSHGLAAHFNDYARDVLSRLCATPRFVVDIGSNDGTLLQAFQQCGCRVLGIDPAEAIARAARAHGVPTFVGFLSRELAHALVAVNGQADIVTANHIMANVANLHDFIEGVRTLLAPDGTFVFETGYWPAIVANNLIDTIEHEHIHYFSVKPLQRFFASHGFTLVHVETNSAKGGSFRGYVQHADHRMTAYTVSRLIRLEEKDDCMTTSALRGWVRTLNDCELEIRAEIAKSDGETWVGYGAAVGSTIQLYQFGLGDKLTCLIDANRQKQGRVSPGYHLPVVDPSELQALKPDRIVILAWRYAEQIKVQHPECAGKWLTLLPELQAS